MIRRKMICMAALGIFVVMLLSLPVRGKEIGMDMGGINILKTNASGEALQGAVFRIARAATEEEMQNPGIKKEIVSVGEERITIVYEQFYSHSSMDGRVIQEVTTDEQGRASLHGLPYGTHYLLETQAPDGYNRITVPIRVTVSKYSHLTGEDGVQDDNSLVIDNTIHIINIRYHTPETGNLVQKKLIWAGSGVVFSLSALLILNRKRCF